MSCFVGRAWRSALISPSMGAGSRLSGEADISDITEQRIAGVPERESESGNRPGEGGGSSASGPRGAVAMAPGERWATFLKNLCISP